MSERRGLRISFSLVRARLSELIVAAFQKSSSMNVQDARRRRVSRLRTARGVSVEEAAFFSILKPGTYVALSYVDDPVVRHEALVTWPSLGVDRAIAILTPAPGWSEWTLRLRWCRTTLSCPG